MTLRLSQFMAELAYDLKVQTRVFAEFCVKCGHRYPIPHTAVTASAEFT
jgi:hypothetical protein